MRLMTVASIRRSGTSKTFIAMGGAIVLAMAGLAMTVLPVWALLIGNCNPLQMQLGQDRPLIDVVVYRGAVVGRSGRWVRPARYAWRPGGAIAAGAAIGSVSAATAAAWAGSPPAPDCCWYYTDDSRTQGFWDVCP
jgi:hypothetical protein